MNIEAGDILEFHHGCSRYHVHDVQTIAGRKWVIWYRSARKWSGNTWDKHFTMDESSVKATLLENFTKRTIKNMKKVQ